MTFWQFLSDNIVWLIVFFILFGSSIAAAYQWTIKALLKHHKEIARIKAGYYNQQPKQPIQEYEQVASMNYLYDKEHDHIG